MKNIYIISSSRTPIGSYGGALSSLSAIELGSLAVKEAIQKANVTAESIECITMGNVLTANLGQAPARQVSMAAGLPVHVCATTVNKVCASGMKAISIMYNDIYVQNCDLGIAGGMENMSRVPHYITNARFGVGYGDSSMIDGLAKDGLTDVYNKTSMGISGDLTAKKYIISREQQDDYAELSYKRAHTAWEKGYFKNEVVPVSVAQKKGDSIIVSDDESYKKANFEKMRSLKPAFSAEGTVTAANASPMNDGASALILASESYVKTNSIKPIAKILAYAEAEQEPLFFTTTPVLATQKVLQRANLTLNDIDFFEVNEAFAVVALAYIKLLGIPQEKVNVFGGAVALGHPLGSSGCRIMVTLLNVLHSMKGKYGLAAICNGGGGASAMVVEKL